jgi:hypothetical protein
MRPSAQRCFPCPGKHVTRPLANLTPPAVQHVRVHLQRPRHLANRTPPFQPLHRCQLKLLREHPSRQHAQVCTNWRDSLGFGILRFGQRRTGRRREDKCCLPRAPILWESPSPTPPVNWLGMRPWECPHGQGVCERARIWIFRHRPSSYAGTAHGEKTQEYEIPGRPRQRSFRALFCPL